MFTSSSLLVSLLLIVMVLGIDGMKRTAPDAGRRHQRSMPRVSDLLVFNLPQDNGMITLLLVSTHTLLRNCHLTKGAFGSSRVAIATPAFIHPDNSLLKLGQVNVQQWVGGGDLFSGLRSLSDRLCQIIECSPSLDSLSLLTLLRTLEQDSLSLFSQYQPSIGDLAINLVHGGGVVAGEAMAAALAVICPHLYIFGEVLRPSSRKLTCQLRPHAFGRDCLIARSVDGIFYFSPMRFMQELLVLAGHYSPRSAPVQAFQVAQPCPRRVDGPSADNLLNLPTDILAIIFYHVFPSPAFFGLKAVCRSWWHYGPLRSAIVPRLQGCPSLAVNAAILCFGARLCWSRPTMTWTASMFNAIINRTGIFQTTEPANALNYLVMVRRRDVWWTTSRLCIGRPCTVWDWLMMQPGPGPRLLPAKGRTEPWRPDHMKFAINDIVLMLNGRAHKIHVQLVQTNVRHIAALLREGLQLGLAGKDQALVNAVANAARLALEPRMLRSDDGRALYMAGVTGETLKAYLAGNGSFLGLWSIKDDE